MGIKKYKLKVSEFNKAYKLLGPLKCPKLNNTDIVFNRHGINHLIRKGKRFRRRSEVLERLHLFQYTRKVIESEISVLTIRNLVIKNLTVYFYGLTLKVDKIITRVIIRQIENGPKHFYSIMRCN
ncbi:MAG TPA: hypothetical protein VJC02_00290 [Candidatus Paceibacterota bacterium]